ncbi:MAG: tetratricopeptide repeat protein [Methanobacterium sp.]
MMNNKQDIEISDLKDFKSWVKEGNDHLIHNEYTAALRCYDNALEKKFGNIGNYEDEDSEIWDNRGVALSSLGRFHDALESFEIALDIKPDNHRAWSNMGVTMAALKRFEEAVNCFNRAIEIKPDDRDAIDNKGTALFSLSKYDEALQSFNEALKLNPNDAKALAGKGSILKFKGEYKEAIECLEKFIKYAPPELAAQNEEAWAMIFDLRLLLQNKDNEV